MTRYISLLAALACVSVLTLATGAGAQTSEEEAAAQDAGFLERIIQNALGGEGRDVRITGLEGALSSDVRIAAIEVADSDGTWLAIRDVAMSWRRLALLRRRVEIDALTVGSVEVVRPPIAPPPPPPSIDLEAEEDPAPRAPFALPELPVSVNLGELSVGRIDLGEALAGQAASLSLDASARLQGGEGGASVQLVRLDGPEGLINLDAGFENATRRLYVTLDVEEDPGGLIATLARFPGAPSLDLGIAGDAPLSDFTADLQLTTDGAERLAGQVELLEEAVGNRTALTVRADIGGDVTPLFAPDYRDFFGEEIGLQAILRRDPETGTEVETFALTSRAIDLDGSASLLPSGLPRLIDVSGRLGAEDGLPVILPLAGPVTQITSGVLRLDYDASEGDAFLARAGLLGFRQDDIRVDTINLDIDGRLSKSDEPLTVTRIAAAVRAQMAGIAVNDPAVDSALQPPVTFAADVTYDPEPGTVAVRDLALVTGDLRLDGTVDVADLGGRTDIDARAGLVTGSLARFAPLVGRDLTGRFNGEVTAGYSVSSGAFDVAFDGEGTGLAIGDARIDPLLAGAAQVALTARRDTAGIALDRLAVRTDEVAIDGTGRVSSRGAALDLDARLAEAGRLRPELSGPLTLSAQADGEGRDYTVALVAGGRALTDLLGAEATLDSALSYDGDAGTLDIADLRLAAGELSAEGRADITGLRDKLALQTTLDLDTGDLARFAPLAGRPLAGSLVASLQAAFDSADTAFDVVLAGTGQDIAIGNPQLDPLFAGRTEIDIDASGADMAATVDRLRVVNPALQVTGAGNLSLEAVDFDLDAALQEVGRFVPHLSGPVTLNARAEGGGQAYRLALLAGGAAITDAIGDPVSLETDLLYDGDAATLGVPRIALRAGDLSAKGRADVTGLDAEPALDAALDLDTGDLRRLARLAGLPLTGRLTAGLDGAYDTASGDFDASLRGQGRDIAIGTPQVDQLLAGQTDIDIAARGAEGSIRLDRLDVTNPALAVTGNGTIAPDGGRVDIDARLANLGIFVPQVSGPLTLRADATGAGTDWTVDAAASGPAGLRATVSGDVAPTRIALDVTGGLDSLGTFVPGLVGGLDLAGNVSGDGSDYFVDLAATSPTGLAARIDGRAWGPAGTSDLAITAGVPLALADGFIRPRSLTGQLNADLALRGAPGLEALSGNLSIDGGRFSDPETRVVLENIALALGLRNAQADVDLSANLATGGRITLSGPVGLEAPNTGDITLVLDALKLVDPQLYEIDLDGRVTLTGPLTGGASVRGRINIPRAEIKIPGATGGGGPIPEMTHLAEAAGSRLTRARAGLISEDRADGETGAPVAYPLDIVIRAPRRIFVRGRGLDVELGGRLDIEGTTARPIPSGRFELIRGRMDLLGRILNFETAEVTLGGDLVPEIFMVATSATATVDANIQIEGPVTNPELTFTSSPELPEDEVLAQVFFGKAVADLTPLEIAQLLSAIDTLTGGGGGAFGALRTGLGVDQLNVQQDEDGNTEVTAGKYLTEDVYTDVTVNAEGNSRINLNYEISPSLTVRGGFDSEGDTRLGITFERDY